MEEYLHQIAENIALVLEVISIIVISIGGLMAVYSFVWPITEDLKVKSRIRRAWLSYARWMLLGLEFTLAADVVRTTIAPTWNAIGQLAAIAVIRTFLNYFLERDLETAMRMNEAEAT